MKTVMEETRENFQKTGSDAMRSIKKPRIETTREAPPGLSPMKQSSTHWKARFTLAASPKKVAAENGSWEGEGAQPRYTFTSHRANGFIQEILLKFYSRAKAAHASWATEKFAFKSRYPPLRQLQLRLADGCEIDKGVSPHLRHIQESIEIVDEVEADKKGTTHEKTLDMNEKFKLAVIYMKMLEDPEKFKHLGRFVGDSENSCRMNLAPADLEGYRELQREVKANELKKATHRASRRRVLERLRYQSVQPGRPVVSEHSEEAQKAASLKKLLLEVNPMDQTKI